MRTGYFELQETVVGRIVGKKTLIRAFPLEDAICEELGWPKPLALRIKRHGTPGCKFGTFSVSVLGENEEPPKIESGNVLMVRLLSKRGARSAYAYLGQPVSKEYGPEKLLDQVFEEFCDRGLENDWNLYAVELTVRDSRGQ